MSQPPFSSFDSLPAVEKAGADLLQDCLVFLRDRYFFLSWSALTSCLTDFLPGPLSEDIILVQFKSQKVIGRSYFMARIGDHYLSPEGEAFTDFMEAMKVARSKMGKRSRNEHVFESELEPEMRERIVRDVGHFVLERHVPDAPKQRPLGRL